MFDKTVIRNNAIAFIVTGLLFTLMIGIPGLGLAGLCVGAIDLLAGFIMVLIGYKMPGRTMLLCGGILFLIGFSVCSAVPLSFH